MNDKEQKDMIETIKMIITVYNFYYRQTEDQDISTQNTIDYVLLGMKLSEQMEDNKPYRFIVDIKGHN